MSDSRDAEIELPIAAWSAWAPGLDTAVAWESWAAGKISPGTDGTPELASVAPLLRRRLSRTARMLLWVAGQCAADRSGLRTVFASRHGELNRTVPMLRELARQRELSPADFSLSVHNSAAGVWSIVRQDRSSSTSVAAGAESFCYGLLEAASQWRTDPNRPVLAVYADEPVPREYRAFVPPEAAPHAIAVLLAREPRSSMAIRRLAASGDSPSAQPASLAFLRALLTGHAAEWVGDRSVWRWRIV